MALKYVTTLDFARVVGMKNDIPSWSPGDHPSKEDVALGTSNTTANYYLDQRNIINNTGLIYYGANSTVATKLLVEPTHYSLDKDTGKLNLTADGTVLVDTDSSTNRLFAEYSYFDLDLPDSYIQSILERAEKKFESETNIVFADGTTATPTYGQSTDEKQTGKGKYDRGYYTQHFPLPDVSTNLIESAGTSANSLTVQSTFGFPESGVIGMSTEKMDYTGKGVSSFTGLTGLSSNYGTSSTVLPRVIELSTTGGGSNPSWTVLDNDVDYDIDLESGRIYIYRDDIGLDVFTTQHPPRLAPNRFRASYIYGYNTIPDDVKRAVLIIAKKMMMTDTVAKSFIAGRNEFNPDLLNAEDGELQTIIDRYKSWKVSNI
jgi:hypothetical protein